MALRELKNIARCFGKLEAVKNVTLTIEAGEFLPLPDGKSLVGLSRAAEALMTNAAPGRAKFHEVGDAVAVCWRHDAGIFLRD